MDGASGGKQDVWEHREKIFWECGTDGNWGYLGYQRKSILEMWSQWGKLGMSGKIGENILEIWMEPVEGNWGCPHWLYIPRMFSPVFPDILSSLHQLCISRMLFLCYHMPFPPVPLTTVGPLYVNKYHTVSSRGNQSRIQLKGSLQNKNLMFWHNL